MVSGCVSQRCCMSLTDSHGCWLSLNFPPVPWCCYVSLTVSHGCRLYLTGPMELLHVTHCLPWLLAVFNSLYSTMELLHVSHCLTQLPAVSHYPFRSHGMDTCLSLSNFVARCFSMSLGSHGVAVYLSLSPMFLDVSDC